MIQPEPKRSRAGDMGRNLRDIAQARSSVGIALVLVALYLPVGLLGGVERWAALYHYLGLTRDGVAGGMLWQVGTYAWLHGGWLHVGLNAAAVLVLGSRIERILGAHGLLWGAGLGVLGGAAGHLLLGTGTLVGFSGGAMALLVLLTTVSPQSRMFPLPVSGRSLGLGVMIAEGLLAVMNPATGLPWFSELGKSLVAHGMADWFRIGHACHVGGGLAGWVCGRWLLRPRVSLKQLRRARARREGDLGM